MDPTTTWKFACGHKYAPVFTGHRGKQAQLFHEYEEATSTDSCPSCKANEVEVQKAPERVLNKDQLAKKDIQIYEAQVDFLNKQIHEAEDIPSTQKYLKNLLRNCKSVWVDKIMEFETKEGPGSGELDKKQDFCNVFRTKVDDAAKKIQLIYEFAQIKLEETRVSARSSKDDEAKANAFNKARDAHAEWARIWVQMELHKNNITPTILTALRKAEYSLGRIWGEAVNQMFREQNSR